MLKSLVVLLLALATNANAQSPAQSAADAANGPACAGMTPLYWEIGDASGVLASGSVALSRHNITRTDELTIASASKWPYGAYVNEVTRGQLSVDDLKYLNFESGWSTFSQCNPGDTVASCASTVGYNKRADGKFDYSGGHMQRHAVTMGLGTLNAAQLGTTINSVLGTTFAYSEPQPAGGIFTSTAAYAAFLQKVMSGQLIDGSYLQANQVETQGRAVAVFSPVPEPWHYGRGHWVELDGTASSPGAFGFYPWITADKKLYGILARSAPAGAWDSVTCGREIRKAYLTPH